MLTSQILLQSVTLHDNVFFRTFICTDISDVWGLQVANPWSCLRLYTLTGSIIMSQLLESMWTSQVPWQSVIQCASLELDGSRETDEQEKMCPRKRTRDESCSGPGSKACREKKRRDRLNDRFTELSSVLEPGKPPKTDKATILCDATRVLNQLRVETQKLKDSNDQLQETIKDLKAEKNELRDEKLRLKAEKEKLEQQVKAMSMPSGFMPHPAAYHAAAAAFAAQSQGVGNKTIPLPGYPGMAMWQWMPPAVVDTSQDHVLRPPVA